MAIATTTLSTAMTITDNNMVVASATSMAIGRVVRIDDEIMIVAQSYNGTSTTVPVLRGRDTTRSQAHVVTANVVHGLASDFATPGPQAEATYVNQKPRIVTSVTATSTLTLPPAGTDMVVILNGTSVITLTVPAPTTDMDGNILWIVSNGVAAHVPTFTGGLDGVGSGYTALTVAAGARLCIQVIACNAAWCVPSAPAWTGTVTKLIGGIA